MPNQRLQAIQEYLKQVGMDTACKYAAARNLFDSNATQFAEMPRRLISTS